MLTQSKITDNLLQDANNKSVTERMSTEDMCWGGCFYFLLLSQILLFIIVYMNRNVVLL